MKVNRTRVYLSIAALTSFLGVVATATILLTHPAYRSGYLYERSPTTSNDSLQLQYLRQPTYKYGFRLDTFKVVEATIPKGVAFSELLYPLGMSMVQIDRLVRCTKHVFDVRRMNAGKGYMVLCDPNSSLPQYLFYEPNVYSYVVFDLKDLHAEVVKRPIEIVSRTATGYVPKGGGWKTANGEDLAPSLIFAMAEALKWSIDFYRIQPNDQFKILYDEEWVEGQLTGVSKVHAVHFNHHGKDYYSFRFTHRGETGYYDQEARPMKKGFLQAPLKYVHITSGYNLQRLHPVLQYVRPHLGTDYAAPYGTPIMAVADGVVEEAGYAGGNGNYVKIRHDQVYQTAYLHMSRIAVRRGTRVKQGETIGYVGATGLATGPHVCFRFWKNGVQVNHLKEKLPLPQPIVGEALEQFKVVRDSLRARLEAIPFTDDHEEVVP